MPGPAAARKQPATDVLVTMPKSIMGMLGGMSCPRIPEQATSAVAYSRLYPYFSICGRIVIPMVATADEDDPDIAPKRAEEMIVTMPNPPWNRPTTALAKETICEEIPAAVITPPAKMKNGIALEQKSSAPKRWPARQTRNAFPEKKSWQGFQDRNRQTRGTRTAKAES